MGCQEVKTNLTLYYLKAKIAFKRGEQLLSSSTMVIGKQFIC